MYERSSKSATSQRTGFPERTRVLTALVHGAALSRCVLQLSLGRTLGYTRALVYVAPHRHLVAAALLLDVRLESRFEAYGPLQWRTHLKVALCKEETSKVGRTLQGELRRFFHHVLASLFSNSTDIPVPARAIQFAQKLAKSFK